MMNKYIERNATQICTLFISIMIVVMHIINNYKQAE